MSLNYIKNFYEGCVSKTMCVGLIFILFFLMFHYFLWQNQEITLLGFLHLNYI